MAPLPNSLSEAFDRVALKAGLSEFTLHDCRHAHATHLLRAGQPVHVVSHRLGHRSPLVTLSVYAHVLDEQAVQAAEAFARAMG